MKVLMINGSPHARGNTFTALNEVGKALLEEGIEYEIMNIGSAAIRGCVACKSCSKEGKCVFDDPVNIAAEKFKDCEGLVIGSPVYFASANGNLISFLDRLFVSAQCDKTMKVGAAVSAARRSGTTATFDQLNKYFTISGMPIASSVYWNGIHGATPGESEQDAEGLLTMRTLGKNMAFLIKAIAEYKNKNGLPEKEPTIKTNFIR